MSKNKFCNAFSGLLVESADFLHAIIAECLTPYVCTKSIIIPSKTEITKILKMEPGVERNNIILNHVFRSNITKQKILTFKDNKGWLFSARRGFGYDVEIKGSEIFLNGVKIEPIIEYEKTTLFKASKSLVPTEKMVSNKEKAEAGVEEESEEEEVDDQEEEDWEGADDVPNVKGLIEEPVIEPMPAKQKKPRKKRTPKVPKAPKASKKRAPKKPKTKKAGATKKVSKVAKKPRKPRVKKVKNPVAPAVVPAVQVQQETKPLKEVVVPVSDIPIVPISPELKKQGADVSSDTILL